MRTLTAHEAIDVAERLNILLFDRYYNSEVTVEQAKLFIQKQRDPVSFVLEDWPETDKEAEQIVLRRFHAGMVAGKWVEASISAVCGGHGDGRGIHPYAAKLAAKRLVEQKELEMVPSDQDETVYRLPHNIHFTEAFLDSLQNLVCDECAHLNPDKPFHKTCLHALLDYLINGSFALSDVTMTLDPTGPSVRLPNLLKQTVNARWLSQTVSATKGRIRSVVKPILARETVDDATVVPNSRVLREHPAEEAHAKVSEGGGTPFDLADVRTRDRISKAELIAYLRSVEIVDEDGELADLRSERDGLRRQLELKEREIVQIERQRALLQGQCEDMQRDMDTLLQAMQIAKRRGQNQTHVIDAEIDSEQHQRQP